MTNQEENQNAIEWIEGIRDSWNDKDNIKYCNMAIKALEKLHKIRAEIQQLETYDKYTGESYLACEFRQDVLYIIDTYTDESEDKT